MMFPQFIVSIFVCSIFLFQFAAADTECPNVPTPNSGLTGDRRTNKDILRLVQYNVEWLFIDYYKSSDCPGNGCSWKNETEATTHMSYVADVINTLDPDIINFCEVEGCDELNMLKDSLTSNALYAPYLKKGTDTSTGQNVGMLTKIDPIVNLYRNENKVNYPVPGSKCGYTGSSSSGVSKHYITEFQLNNMKVVMMGVHFIAFPTDPARCAQREAQAQIIQNVIYSYVQNGYEIVVIGDMNDYDAEVGDIDDHQPTSQALDVLKGLKGDYANTYSLMTVGSLIPAKEDRFTDWWDSDNNCATTSKADYSVIDHVLLSANLEKKITSAYFYHGYTEYCGKYNSDHYPIVVEFSTAA